MSRAWLATFASADDDGPAVAGFVQRVAIIAGFRWLGATALIALGRPDRAPSYAFG